MNELFIDGIIKSINKQVNYTTDNVTISYIEGEIKVDKSTITFRIYSQDINTFKKIAKKGTNIFIHGSLIEEEKNVFIKIKEYSIFENKIVDVSKKKVDDEKDVNWGNQPISLK